MISGIVIRRLLIQALMWPHLGIKIDPALGFVEEFSQRAIGPASGYSELKYANEPLSALKRLLESKGKWTGAPSGSSRIGTHLSALRLCHNAGLVARFLSALYDFIGYHLVHSLLPARVCVSGRRSQAPALR
jgi:hypothetical protein